MTVRGQPLFLPIKCIFAFTPKLSRQFLLFWVFFVIFCDFRPSSDSKFYSPLTSSISLSLEALAPLAGHLPLGVLAELALWFTHSVPSGLTGWHKDMEQDWERRAGSMDIQTHTAIYFWKKVIAEGEWLFEVQTMVLGLWFLWVRQKIGDWSGRYYSVGLHLYLEESIRVRHTCGLTLKSHWPHTPLLHLQLEERGKWRERHREETEREKESRGEMYFIYVVP